MTKCESIRQAAMKLKPKERADLADALFASLGEKYREDLASSWTEELDRRWEAYKRGELKTIPAEEVIRELRAGQRP